MSEPFLPTTTVKSLIEALQKLPQDYAVYTEGCDCVGECVSVSVNHDEREIMLNRSAGDRDDINLPVRSQASYESDRADEIQVP